MSVKITHLGLALFVTVAAIDSLCLPAFSPNARAESTAITAGQAAPAFTLPDSNGRTVSLSDYKGQYVVLEWVNFGCPFVKKHYDSKHMQGLQDKYTKKGVAWLSINSSAAGKQGNLSSADINAALKKRNAHPTAYLVDQSGKVGRLYGANTTPDMYVIDPTGKVVYSGAIDDTNSTDVADIKTAKNYVSAALDAALAGKAVAVASTKSYGCSVKYSDD